MSSPPRRRRFLIGLLICSMLPACAETAVDSTRSVDEPIYTEGPATRGGRGKYYMGREIAYTMSHLGAGWLDRPEREREERTDVLLQALPLRSDSVVADIGAGSGYFALRLAPRLATGKVLAVDIQPEMLDIIDERAAAAGINNIELVLAEERSPGLQPETVDLAFMVDAYHEFEWPREVMLSLYEAMRPGGRVVLIEYRAEYPWVPIIPVHKMAAAQVQLEMEAVGFSFVQNLDVLPQQHYLEFKRPE